MTTWLRACAVFIMLSYSADLMPFIYIVKTLGMLNGQYAFLAISLTLDSAFWTQAGKDYGLVMSDVDGNT